jgi:hypothetical protein
MKVLLHQNVEGKHAGETVDSSTIEPDRLAWLIGEGYASTAKSRGTDHADVQTAVDLDKCPSEPGNAAAVDGPERVNTTPPAVPNPGLNPPEAFDPTACTEKEIKAYVDGLPEGAGKNKETDRITAVVAREVVPERP